MTILLVKIIPNAKKNSVEGFYTGRLKIKINAPPDKGKANEALINYLANLLHIPKSRISIASGHSSQLKKIVIEEPVDLDSFLSQFT